MNILTHRALDPDIPDFPPESSFDGFKNQIDRGYGIEFDVNFNKNNDVVIFHGTIEDDKNLCSLNDIMELIATSNAPIHALHLKRKFQQKKYIEILLQSLEKYANELDKLLIFDVLPNVAKMIHDTFSHCHLAPSVAHEFDIERFNEAVHGTLISTSEAIKHRDIYDWVWLDEWDLKDKNGKTKTFYNAETFSLLKNAGFMIGLVTPELHATSPGLLGGEHHEDARPDEQLFNRIKKIIALKPDAICTDHPDRVRKIYDSIKNHKI